MRCARPVATDCSAVGCATAPGITEVTASVTASWGVEVFIDCGARRLVIFKGPEFSQSRDPPVAMAREVFIVEVLYPMENREGTIRNTALRFSTAKLAAFNTRWTNVSRCLGRLAICWTGNVTRPTLPIPNIAVVHIVEVLQIRLEVLTGLLLPHQSGFVVGERAVPVVGETGFAALLRRLPGWGRLRSSVRRCWLNSTVEGRWLRNRLDHARTRQDDCGGNCGSQNMKLFPHLFPPFGSSGQQAERMALTRRG